MTPKDLTEARRAIGIRWGFKRPLKRAELARALNVTDQTVTNWEAGRTAINGPALAFLRAMLAGALPADPLDQIRTPSPHQ